MGLGLFKSKFFCWTFPLTSWAHFFNLKKAIYTECISVLYGMNWGLNPCIYSHISIFKHVRLHFFACFSMQLRI
uniref:Putative ovule protein n=1 Tax=Solanum chacoense TaxID=4108 RepID=A0A0V0IZA4_SOLCH